MLGKPTELERIEPNELPFVQQTFSVPAENSVSTTDPDTEWNYAPNEEYDHIAWYSTPDNAFEKRLSVESPMDKFSGLNWSKMPVKENEYYGSNNVPLFEYEWDENEYYRTQFKPSKSDEEVAKELDAPRQAMEQKYNEFVEKGEEVCWTPLLEKMASTEVPKARKLEYEISPFFQLNKDGFRKSWANTAVVEMRPFSRLQSNWVFLASDYFFRFQIMRNNLTSKARLRYWKSIMVLGFFGVMIDHIWARNYRRTMKWH